MTNNLNAFSAQGMRFAYWALYDTASPSYIAGTSGTLANAADSGMGRALGISEFTATVPDAPIIDIVGDNGLIGSMIANPVTGPNGTAAYGSFDQTFDTAATNRVIKTEGPHDISLSSNVCYQFDPIFLVVNSPGFSNVSGSQGEAGWIVEEYLYTFVQPTSVSSKSMNTAHSYTHRLIFNERGTTHYGETITEGNYGVTKAWKTDPYWSPNPIFYHTYVGDGGSSQTFTLDKIPVADDGNALQIWDNGSKLTHTTNYTVNTTTGVVTFVGTDPAAGQFAVCKVQYAADC
jgi:hypothetical protein